MSSAHAKGRASLVGRPARVSMWPRGRRHAPVPEAVAGMRAAVSLLASPASRIRALRVPLRAYLTRLMVSTETAAMAVMMIAVGNTKL